MNKITVEARPAAWLLAQAAELNAAGRGSEAMVCLWQALALDPSDPDIWVAAGTTLGTLQRQDESRAVMQSVLDRWPLHAGAWRAAGMLAKRRVARGTALRRAALLGLQDQADAPRQSEEVPRLSTEKSIAVVADGGLDEALPLLGLVPELARRGARVTLQVPEPWLPLLAGIEGVAVVGQKQAMERHDATCLLSCLPSAMGWGEAKLPPLPLGPRSEAGGLPVPLGTRLKVGLLWDGGKEDEELFPGLLPLLPLCSIAGATFYGLQTGPRAQDIRKLADPALIIDLSPGLRDLGALAAAVSQLDLVITADGAMPHLARSLGVPAWVLLSHRSPAWQEDFRCYRQDRPSDWRKVISTVGADLRAMVSERAVSAEERADLVADAVFPDAEGKPRFRMTAPRHFLSDPGIRFLMTRERAGTGYEYATRSFLDAHLRPGDLFIDIGAHWGIMSLQAATRWPGKVDVLAVEPSPHNQPHLERWLADNYVAGRVERVWAFAADAPGKGALKPQSTMGHSLVRAEDGEIPVVTIDGLLAERAALRKAKRVIVKIDVEGHEPEVIEGMKGLLASREVATVIWERGREYDTPAGQKRLADLRAKFSGLGYTAWRFESEDEAGALVPFAEDGRLGNIFELKAGMKPQTSYGMPRRDPPAQPQDSAFDRAMKARSLFSMGFDAHRAGKTAEARDLYRQSISLDATQSSPYNNLGALFRSQNNRPAAAAAFSRAMALAPGDRGVMSNCGNALREVGEFERAARILRRALIEKPDDAGPIYNLGVLAKDTGRPEQAVILFDRALALSQDDPEYSWDRSLALLQAGDYRRGFEAYESRWGLKRAAKRKIPLPRWDGSPLAGRSIFLSDEQGFGDVLQWARFVAPLKRDYGAARIVMECQPELMRLMSLLPDVDEVVPRAKAVPDCDVTLPLLSLPHLFGTTLETLPTTVPYLTALRTQHRLRDDGRLKLGLVWAGKPTPRDRSIGLEKLLPLLGDPRIAAYSLQIGPRAADIGKWGADLLVTDLAPILTDFAETAAILAQLDLLITIDSAVAHLAGALGVKTFLLLRKVSDWRWFDHRTDSPWYPTMTLFRQTELDRWDEPLEALGLALRGEFTGKS